MFGVFRWRFFRPDDANELKSEQMRNLQTFLIAIAISTIMVGCSPEEHRTEVTLPDGSNCSSETYGTFWHESRNLSCTDSHGKVIGSYKSD